MSFVVNLNQFFHRYMSVDLGSGQTGMAQEFLNVTKIRPTVEQMRSERVPQRVGADVVNAGAQFDVLFDQTADGAGRHSRALVIQD